VPVIVLILVSTAAGLAAWRCAGAALRTWWGRAPAAAVAYRCGLLRPDDPIPARHD